MTMHRTIDVTPWLRLEPGHHADVAHLVIDDNGDDYAEHGLSRTDAERLRDALDEALA